MTFYQQRLRKKTSPFHETASLSLLKMIWPYMHEFLLFANICDLDNSTRFIFNSHNYFGKFLSSCDFIWIMNFRTGYYISFLWGWVCTSVCGLHVCVELLCLLVKALVEARGWCWDISLNHFFISSTMCICVCERGVGRERKEEREWGEGGGEGKGEGGGSLRKPSLFQLAGQQDPTVLHPPHSAKGTDMGHYSHLLQRCWGSVPRVSAVNT